MKNLIIILSVGLLFGLTSCNQSTAENTTPNTTVQPQAKPVTSLPKQPTTKPGADSPINWMTFDEAQAAMKNEPKKLFVDVYTYWCGPCKMLDRNTFSNPKLADFVNENYYAIKFNAQDENDIMFAGKTFSNPNYDPNKGQYRRNGTNQLAAAMGVRAFPTMVILNEQMQIMHAVRGYKTPQQLQPVLEQFAKM